MNKKQTVPEKKKEQGWGLRIRQCHDCRHIKTRVKEIKNNVYHTALRCGLGDFVTKKTATCKKWK